MIPKLKLHQKCSFKILVVFKIVRRVTPVSANTACHISAIPNKLNNNVNIFTPIANIKF